MTGGVQLSEVDSGVKGWITLHENTMAKLAPYISKERRKLWYRVNLYLVQSLPFRGKGACTTQWSYEPCRTGPATQDKRVIADSSGKMWSTGEGNSKPPQYIHCEDSWTYKRPVLWSSDTNRRLTGKVPDKKDWAQKEKRVSEDEMAGWHHWCNEHELGQTLGDGEGQGGLACFSPKGSKESNMTGWLNKGLLKAILTSIFTLWK